MKKNVFYLLVLLFFIGFQTVRADHPKKSTKIYLIQFHADWCGACKAIKPTLLDLQNQINPDEVQFVKLDFTNKTTRKESEERLESLGFSSLLNSYKGTGFVVVVDAETGKDLSVLYRNQSSSDMLKVINKYL